MAVGVEPKRETVAVEPAGQPPRMRLHEEVLPPTLSPAVPVVVRSARRALAVLAAAMIVVQVVSAPIGHRLSAVAKAGTDAYSVWQHYASNPVPDLLVLGNSLAQTDIDEASLSAELSQRAGRPITVEKMAFNGEGPLFYDAVMYRIMKRAQHPKWIVVTTLARDFNANGCSQCRALLTSDLWDISDLTDPDFVRLALQIDPDPALLAAGWGLPALAYYPSIGAVQCVAINYARSTAMKILGRVPRQLQDPSVCETQPGYLLLAGWAHQPAMTPYGLQRSTESYRLFMADYQISEKAVSSLESVISRAHEGGVQVLLLESPAYSQTRALFPEAQQAYQQRVGAIASSLGVHLVNLSDAVPDDPTLWADTQHLDRAGAAYLAPRLAGALAPNLAG